MEGWNGGGLGPDETQGGEKRCLVSEGKEEDRKEENSDQLISGETAGLCVDRRRAFALQKWETWRRRRSKEKGEKRRAQARCEKLKRLVLQPLCLGTYQPGPASSGGCPATKPELPDRSWERPRGPNPGLCWAKACCNV